MIHQHSVFLVHTMPSHWFVSPGRAQFTQLTDLHTPQIYIGIDYGITPE